MRRCWRIREVKAIAATGQPWRSNGETSFFLTLRCPFVQSPAGAAAFLSKLSCI